jgi:hypothetical protein
MLPFDVSHGDDSLRLQAESSTLPELTTLCGSTSLGDLVHIISAAGPQIDASWNALSAFSAALLHRLARAEREGIAWSHAHDAAASAPQWVGANSSTLLRRSVALAERRAHEADSEAVVRTVLKFRNPVLRTQVIWHAGPLTESSVQQILTQAPRLRGLLAIHPDLTPNAAQFFAAFEIAQESPPAISYW